MIRLQFLVNVGIDEKQIARYVLMSSKEHISELEQNWRNVTDNLLCLEDMYRPRDLLLFLSFFPYAFCMNHVRFKERMDRLKEALPFEWSLILMLELESKKYDKRKRVSYLKVINNDEQKVEEALNYYKKKYGRD